MGYMHVNNLYRDQRILLFKEVYALEKLHGTSAHVSWRAGALSFFSGGEKHERFVKLFDQVALQSAFTALGLTNVTVYGEAYGGSQQKQAYRYGPTLRFAAFDVEVGDLWLAVPQAHELVKQLGLEFVHFVKVSTDLAALDAERDAPSEQARRNGVEGDKFREGVVLRPLIELRDHRGERVMAKHKRDEERETATPRAVISPEKQVILDQAQAIADEWVTLMRLEHVLDKLKGEGVESGIEATGTIMRAMIEDVLREGAGEIVDSREARAAIGRKAAELFKLRLKSQLG